jgi:6-phosphogluconolactonase
MKTRARVETFDSPNLLADRASELFLSAARRATEQQGRFTVALSGGESPVPLLGKLADKAVDSGIDWTKVHIFWADERCVPPDHPDSNFRLAHDLLLSRLPPPGAVCHRIKGELPPEDGAQAYREDLRTFFPSSPLPEFDQIWLGVGNDGHTASLFPGNDQVSSADSPALAVYVESLRSHRVTLTLPAINNARQVFFIATGTAKAEVVTRILERSADARYPASLVDLPAGSVTWLLDREAAGLL